MEPNVAQSHCLSTRVYHTKSPSCIDTLFAFYTRDQAHAEQRATELLQEHPFTQLDLKAYPQGFVIHHTRIERRLEK